MFLFFYSHLYKPLHSCLHTDGHHTHSFFHELDCPPVGGKCTVHTGIDLKNRHFFNSKLCALDIFLKGTIFKFIQLTV